MTQPFLPESQLQLGAEFLRPLLEGAGFKFALLHVGNSSGGRAAVGEFARGSRRVELHYRYGLGIVVYHVGDDALSHEEMMRAQGARKSARFPVVLDKTLAGLHAVLDDLREHGEPFLAHGVERFAALAAWCRTHPRPKGYEALEHWDEGEPRLAGDETPK